MSGDDGFDPWLMLLDRGDEDDRYEERMSLDEAVDSGRYDYDKEVAGGN